jgi:crotonobetainyl-CoA:carnitine CoA-transferase CaiB-like acyl-CoA transferase
VLGEHTREVLRKTLGYDDVRIAALEEAGAFGKILSNV